MAKAIQTKVEKKDINLTNTTINWVGRFLFFLFTVLFLGVYNADELYFMSVNSYLIFNDITQTFILDRTAGVLVLLGRMLNQSFVIPLLGASLFGGILILIQYLLEKLYRVRGVMVVLTYLLPALLLLYTTSAGYALYTIMDADFACVALLGTLFVLLIFALYRISLKWKYGGYVVAILTLFLAPVLGVYAVLASAMIFLENAVNKAPRWYLFLVIFVASLLMLLFGGRYIFCERYMTALLSPSPFSYLVILKVMVVLIWIFLIVTPLISVPFSTQKKSWEITSKSALISYAVCLFAVMGAVYGLSYRDENFRAEMTLTRLCEEQKWAEMSKVVSEIEKPTRVINVYRIIASVRQNKLTEELFDFQFPLAPSDGHYLSDEPAFYEDAYFHASLLNAHYLFASEMSMQIKPTNKRLKYMAIYALMNGEDLLAERFLLQLKKSWVYKSWAENFEKYVGNRTLFLKENPYLADIIEKEPTSVDLIKLDISLAEQFLKTEKFPLKSFEYRLLAGLYEKQIKRFVSDIQRVKIERLPICMQEALVIAVIQYGVHPAILQAYHVEREVAIKVNKFFNELKTYCSNKEKEQAMKIMERYKGSYCYYYAFY